MFRFIFFWICMFLYALDCCWPNFILEHGITQNQNNYRAQNEIVGHAHIGIDSACFLGLWSFQSCVWMSEEHWKVQGSRSRIQIQIWPKATDFSETRPWLSTMHRFFVHEEHEGSPLLREIDQDQNCWIKTSWSGAYENRTICPKSRWSFSKLGRHKINLFEVDEIRPHLEVFLKFPKSLLFHVSQGCTPCTRHVANALAGNLRSLDIEVHEVFHCFNDFTVWVSNIHHSTIITILPAVHVNLPGFSHLSPREFAHPMFSIVFPPCSMSETPCRSFQLAEQPFHVLLGTLSAVFTAAQETREAISISKLTKLLSWKKTQFHWQTCSLKLRTSRTQEIVMSKK